MVRLIVRYRRESGATESSNHPASVDIWNLIIMEGSSSPFNPLFISLSVPILLPVCNYRTDATVARSSLSRISRDSVTKHERHDIYM